MSIVDLDEYEEEEGKEAQVDGDADEDDEEGQQSETMVDDSSVPQSPSADGQRRETASDTVTSSPSPLDGNIRSAPFRQSSSSQRSRRSSTDLLLAKASLASPTNPRMATLLGLPPSTVNLMDDGDGEEELTETTNDDAHASNGNRTMTDGDDADIKQAILHRSAQRHNNNKPGSQTIERSSPERSKDRTSTRRDAPPAVAVRGPGAHDPSSMSLYSDDDDDSSASFDMPHISEALVARVVTSSMHRLDDSERQRIIENAQLQVWEQIEHFTPRAEVVAVVHSNDDSSERSSTSAAHQKPPTVRHTSSKWWIAIVLVVLAVGVGVLLLVVRRNNEKEPSTAPPVVLFLREVSSETDIRYPLPKTNPTPAERAVDWVVKNFDIETFDASLASSIERTSLIQKFVLATLGFQSPLPGDFNWLTKPNITSEDDDCFCVGDPVECGWENVICSGDGHVVELHFGTLIRQGTIPKDLTLLTRLFHLDLQSNSLMGTIPTELFQLTNLRTLLIFDNLLTGSIPTEIANLKMAERIEVDVNGLRGKIPREIGQLTFLTVLYLNQNRLTGTLPTELGLLTSLELLNAGDNILTGEIPSDFSAWDAMAALFLNTNEFFGTMPESMRTGLGSLQILDLRDNGFSGSLEQIIGNWTLLQELDIDNNEITGSIPTSLAQLKSLEKFHAELNFLEGSLPSSMGQLTWLSDVSLGDNFFRGTIPSEFGLLTGMVTFDIHTNSLLGSLPTALGSWSEIKTFEIENNGFTGMIPTEFSKWSFLKSGLFQNNQFTGNMPVCTSASLDAEELVLYVNCNEVSCECCSHCCYQSDDPSCCGDAALIGEENDCCGLEFDESFCVKV